MKNFNNSQDQKFYNEFYDLLKKEYNFNDEIIDKIYDVIDNHTNENFNFEYTRSSYDDYIDEDIIYDFIKNNIWKYDNFDDVKCDFEYYLYDKFIFDSKYYYYEYLYEDLDKIELKSEKKWIIEKIDSNEVLNLIEENFWILDIDFNINDLCLNEYKVTLYSNNDNSIFTSSFYDGDYFECEYVKSQLKKNWKNNYLLQKLCKIHGFDIDDIFYYEDNDNENTKRYKKCEKLYNENPFFHSLYKEFVNCMWYQEEFCLLRSFTIDEILSFCLKDYKYEIKSEWLSWFNGSLFDLNIQNPLKINSNELSLWFYKWSYIQKTYDFSRNIF